MQRQYWITVQGHGTVFSTDDDVKAEEKYNLWCTITDDLPRKEVILFADLGDGEGAVIWKQQ